MSPLGETGKRGEGPGVFLTTTRKPTILLTKKSCMWVKPFHPILSGARAVPTTIDSPSTLSLLHSFTHTQKLRSVKRLCKVTAGDEKGGRALRPPAAPQASDTAMKIPEDANWQKINHSKGAVKFSNSGSLLWEIPKWFYWHLKGGALQSSIAWYHVLKTRTHKTSTSSLSTCTFISVQMHTLIWSGRTNCDCSQPQLPPGSKAKEKADPWSRGTWILTVTFQLRIQPNSSITCLL